MPLAPEWQHPFVNVFKLCDVETMKEVESKGDVTEHMDKIIGKKVFKIRGIIPAVNYLRVPSTKLQTLGLTGRLLYIQLKATPVKVFVIHVEVATEDGNVHRISISNMYSPEALKRKSNGVQLPFPKPSHRWCVLGVDLRDALRSYTSSPYACIRAITMCSWLTVRTMFTSDYKFNLTNLPSDMALSHALDTSVFEMVWLPAEPTDAPTMDFMPPPKRVPARRRTTDPSAAAAHTSVAGSSKAGSAAKSARPSSAAGKPSARSRTSTPGVTTAGSPSIGGATPRTSRAGTAPAPSEPLSDDLSDDISIDHDNGSPPPPSPSKPPPLSPAVVAAMTKRVTEANLAAATAAATVTAVGPRRSPGLARPTTAVLPPGTTTSSAVMRPPIASATLGHVNGPDQGPPLEPDPALELLRMNAYSGEFVRALVWVPGGEWVAFAAASVVVLMHVGAAPVPPGAAAAGLGVAPRLPQAAGRQRHLLGHTAFVCALAVSADGGLLASAQEGKQALVRLWDVASGACLAILNGHSSGLSCVDISPDVRAVAAVGLDAQARQTIALWNIAELRSAGKAELVTRHPTEYNIKVLRFSAYQEDHLVTAGRDSIRIYRLKNGQLRGTSVRLVPTDKRVTSHAGGVSAALGPNIFTDIAFEAGVGVYGVDAFKVYVSSASGAVFQVDYTTRSLDAVFQLHSAAINVLLVADGLAITGGDDRLLRAWPLDFRDYLLEAEHEAAVTGIALSPDALRLAIGTENGTLGCLHIPNHAYTNLLRSHCGAVNAVAVDPNRDQFCTVSSDGTLRIWDLATHAQLYEFDAPGEAVTCIAYHPLPQHHELAAGFANGRVRVFDVPTTTLLQEQQQHRAAVAELLFAPSGDRLFSGGMDGALVVYDVQRMYAPTQFLSAGVRDIKVCVAMSSNGAFFATVSRDPYRGITSLLVFHGRSLDPFMRIETQRPAYIRLAFSADCNELWALSTDRCLERYELKDGQLVQQVHEVSAQDVTCLALDPLGRYSLTAGHDGLLRLWGCTPIARLRPHSLPPNQAFLGHPSAVLGAAFHRGHLITVGDADCICIWRVMADVQAAVLALATAAVHARGMSPAAEAAARHRIAAAAAAAAAAVTPGPQDPRSRAHPSTALGPVATAADHQLTARASALATPLQLMAPAASPHPPASAHGMHLHQQLPPGASQLRAAAVVSPAGGPATLLSPSPLTSTPTRSAAPHGHQAHQGQAPPPMATLASGMASLHMGSPLCRGGALATSSPGPGPHSPTQPPLAVRPPTATTSPRLMVPQGQHAVAQHSPSGPPPAPRCSWLLGYTPTPGRNVAWHANTGLFAYTVEDTLVLEHLANRSQRYLRGHTVPLSCVAASADGAMLAAAPAAAEPVPTGPAVAARTVAEAVVAAATGATFADVVVWDADSGEERWRLRYHPLGVQSICFSPDGRWLLSLGRDPERSVVVWDVLHGLLVAAGRTEHSPAAAEWMCGGDNPVFASVGGDGLMLWTLQDSFLEQRSIPLSGRPGQYGSGAGDSSDGGGVAGCVALAVDPAGAILVAEGPSAADRVAVWHVEVMGGSASMVQVAALPGGSVVTALAVGLQHALVATQDGTVLRFRRSTYSGTWAEDSTVRLDGRVSTLCAEPGMCDAVAATSTSTIWFVGMQDGSAVPIVCGQPAPLTGLVAAPHDPRVVAATSSDGLLRVWRLGPEDAEPALELKSTVPCTSAAFLQQGPPPPLPANQQPPPDPLAAADSLALPPRPGDAAAQAGAAAPQPRLLGGYVDGSLRLFSVEGGVELVWALARHAAPVMAVAPHPRKPLVLTAASDGSLAVTDLHSTRLVAYVTAYTAAGPVPASPGSTAARKQLPANAPRGGTGPLQSVAVSPGSGASICAAAWRDRLVVFHTPWEDTTCTPMAVYECKPADGRSDAEDTSPAGLLSPDVPALVCFLPGATKHLAYSSPLLLGRVLLYDYRLAAVVRSVAVPQMVRSLCPHPDGTALLLGGTGGTAFLVDVDTARQQALGGHPGAVCAAAVTADGAHAVTAAGSVLLVWDVRQALRVWEAPTMQQLMRGA